MLALMLCYGAVLLRGSDERSHEDFAAVSHSLNCGTPAPRSYCFFCELASSVGFSQKLAELCVRYVRGMPEVTIDGSALGWSWEETYNAATKEEAEAVVHKRALPTGGFLMVTAGQPRQCYRRSIRNPARACRSFNSVIWLSLAGTMFATVVTRSWSSLTVYHGCLAVRSVAYFMGERPVVFEWQNGDVLPGHRRATCRVLAMSRGPPLRSSVGRCACPTPSAVSVHPALRVGISGAEMIGQEYIRNVGYQQLASPRGAERNQNGVTWLEIFWNLATLL